MALEGSLQEELKPRNRFIPILLTLVALNAFATVIWYAYNWGKGSLDDSALPVIASDDTPIKVRPADEGGLEIPHQDKLVLNSGAEAGTVEHLLPPPEEPIALSIVDAKQAGVQIEGLGHQLEASKPNPPVVAVEAADEVVAPEPKRRHRQRWSRMRQAAPASTSEALAPAPEPAASACTGQPCKRRRCPPTAASCFNWRPCRIPRRRKRSGHECRRPIRTFSAA